MPVDLPEAPFLTNKPALISQLTSFPPHDYSYHYLHEHPNLFLQGLCASRSSCLRPHSQGVSAVVFPEVLDGGASPEVVQHCSLREHRSRSRGRPWLLRIYFPRHCRYNRKVWRTVHQGCPQVYPNKSGLSKGASINAQTCQLA